MLKVMLYIKGLIHLLKYCKRIADVQICPHPAVKWKINLRVKRFMLIP